MIVCCVVGLDLCGIIQQMPVECIFCWSMMLFHANALLLMFLVNSIFVDMQHHFVDFYWAPLDVV